MHSMLNVTGFRINNCDGLYSLRIDVKEFL